MNVSWEVMPGRGFEGCQLRVSRAELRATLGPPDASFNRVHGGPLIDDYQRLGAQVSYDDDDLSCFVEVASPAAPTIAGVVLIGRPARAVYEDLRSRGIEVVEDDAGASLPRWGVGLFVVDSEIEAVSVGDG